MPRYFLRSDVVREAVDGQHLTHAHVAQRLGFSRAYWSQLVNRRRPLTATSRTLILSSGLFTGIAEDQLWERVPDGGAS